MTIATRAFDERLVNLGFVTVIASHGFCHDTLAMNRNIMPFVAEQRFADKV